MAKESATGWCCSRRSKSLTPKNESAAREASTSAPPLLMVDDLQQAQMEMRGSSPPSSPQGKKRVTFSAQHHVHVYDGAGTTIGAPAADCPPTPLKTLLQTWRSSGTTPLARATGGIVSPRPSAIVSPRTSNGGGATVSEGSLPPALSIQVLSDALRRPSPHLALPGASGRTPKHIGLPQMARNIGGGLRTPTASLTRNVLREPVTPKECQDPAPARRPLERRASVGDTPASPSRRVVRRASVGDVPQRIAPLNSTTPEVPSAMVLQQRIERRNSLNSIARPTTSKTTAVKTVIHRPKPHPKLVRRASLTQRVVKRPSIR